MWLSERLIAQFIEPAEGCPGDVAELVLVDQHTGEEVSLAGTAEQIKLRINNARDAALDARDLTIGQTFRVRSDEVFMYGVALGYFLYAAAVYEVPDRG